MREALRKLRNKISRQRRVIQRIRTGLRKKKKNELELLEDLKAAERLRKRKKRRRQRLRLDPKFRPRWNEERRQRRREQLADEIEALESMIDELLEALDGLSKRSDRAERELKRREQRVRELRKRKRRIQKELKEQASNPLKSKYFVVSEFNCREGGPVPDYMYGHLADLCDRVLDKMRERFGAARVTSGHRWSWYDAKIGGVGGYHVYEKYRRSPAADLVFAKGTPAEWAAYARSLGVGGVGQYDRSGFVHVDTGPRRDWWG
jgi:hypothetical protein